MIVISYALLSRLRKYLALTIKEPPNGGPIGNGVILATFCIYAIVVGIEATFGLTMAFLLEDSTLQGASFASLAWVSSISIFLELVLGLGVGVACEKLGYRKVCALGGIFIGGGFVLSSYATNVSFLYFSYSLLVGVGLAFSYGAASIGIGNYFTTLAAYANGISGVGACVGTIVMSIAIEALVSRLGWRSTFRLLGPIFSIVTIASSLAYVPLISSGLVSEENKLSEQLPSVNKGEEIIEAEEDTTTTTTIVAPAPNSIVHFAEKGNDDISNQESDITPSLSNSHQDMDITALSSSITLSVSIPKEGQSRPRTPSSVTSTPTSASSGTPRAVSISSPSINGGRPPLAKLRMTPMKIAERSDFGVPPSPMMLPSSMLPNNLMVPVGTSAPQALVTGETSGPMSQTRSTPSFFPSRTPLSPFLFSGGGASAASIIPALSLQPPALLTLMQIDAENNRYLSTGGIVQSSINSGVSRSLSDAGGIVHHVSIRRQSSKKTSSGGSSPRPVQHIPATVPEASSESEIKDDDNVISKEEGGPEEAISAAVAAIEVMKAVEAESWEAAMSALQRDEPSIVPSGGLAKILFHLGLLPVLEHSSQSALSVWFDLRFWALAATMALGVSTMIVAETFLGVDAVSSGYSKQFASNLYLVMGISGIIGRLALSALTFFFDVDLVFITQLFGIITGLTMSGIAIYGQSGSYLIFFAFVLGGIGNSVFLLSGPILASLFGVPTLPYTLGGTYTIRAPVVLLAAPIAGYAQMALGSFKHVWAITGLVLTLSALPVGLMNCVCKRKTITES